MGIAEKIANAKKTNWLTDGIPENEVKTLVELAKISARIEMARLELNMTQKEFADYMGVTQGMVSKWESREYNFTIRALNEISAKIGMNLSVDMYKPCHQNNYIMLKWDNDKDKKNKIKIKQAWILKDKGIA